MKSSWGTRRQAASAMFGERSATHDQLGEQQAGEQTVAGRSEIAKDHVPRLLAAEDPRLLFEREQDVAVAHVGLFDLDARAARVRGGARGCSSR